MLRFIVLGIVLHITKILYTIIGYEDNTFLIKVFRNSLKGIDIRPFLFTKQEIENSLFPYAKEFKFGVLILAFGLLMMSNNQL